MSPFSNSEGRKKKWMTFMETNRMFFGSGRDDDENEMNENKSCLIVVDMQNDFLLPTGALSVPNSEEIIEDVNALVDVFSERNELVIFTQDWHCPEHSSFASGEKNKKPFDEVVKCYKKNEGGEVKVVQTLWPDHCVQGTKGAEFHERIRVPTSAKVIRKGFRKQVDSYSAFLENDKETETGLSEFIRGVNKGLELSSLISSSSSKSDDNAAKIPKITHCVIVGVAFDYCVRFTAEDAFELFDRVVVLEDVTRAVNLSDSVKEARKAMEQKGVHVVKISDGDNNT
jgi:nicotinamidase/pyrazinamidase